MDAFGSGQAHSLFARLRSAWLLFPIDMHNARVRAGGGVPDPYDLKELDRLRRDARAAATALREQLAAELRGETGYRVSTEESTDDGDLEGG